MEISLSCWNSNFRPRLTVDPDPGDQLARGGGGGGGLTARLGAGTAWATCFDIVETTEVRSTNMCYFSTPLERAGAELSVRAFNRRNDLPIINEVHSQVSILQK